MNKIRLTLFLILLIASFLRFYNLLFDAPYFFNPDERNMANAIVQLRVPAPLKDWPGCFLSAVSSMQLAAQEDTANRVPPAADCNLHPHFFAYGQFPLYLSFFSSETTRRILAPIVRVVGADIEPTGLGNYGAAIFWLRFWSALSSVSTVFVVYLITKESLRLKPTTHNSSSLSRFGPSLTVEDLRAEGPQPTTILPLVAALLVAVTPGLIQSAHFGTTESLLTFFFLTSVYVSLRLTTHLSAEASAKEDNAHRTPYILLALVCGFAFGTKLTGLFCLVPPAIAAAAQAFLIIRTPDRRTRNGIRFVASWFIFLGLTIGISVAASPYNLIDLNGFQGSVFGYEKDVATGAYRAFYTRQFEHTAPILFQMEKVFPYALGLPLYIGGLAGFLFIVGSLIWQIISALWKEISRWKTTDTNHESRITNHREDPVDTRIRVELPSDERTGVHYINNAQLLILIISFLTYLIPNSILYAKWTRFLTPIFPFFSIFAVIFWNHVHSVFSMYRLLGYWIIGVLALISLLPGLAFFSIYLRDDVRVTATQWIYANIPDQSSILFDTGNVIDIPLSLPETHNSQPTTHNYTLVSFDFYHLEENAELLPKLLAHLEQADYIFIPSRRIFVNHLRRAAEFPTIAAYYHHLFDGSLGFEEVARFSSFPALGPVQFPDEQAEETSTVFDHPVIRIYKKTRPMSMTDYRSLLQVKN